MSDEALRSEQESAQRLDVGDDGFALVYPVALNQSELERLFAWGPPEPDVSTSPSV